MEIHRPKRAIPCPRLRRRFPFLRPFAGTAAHLRHTASRPPASASSSCASSSPMAAYSFSVSAACATLTARLQPSRNHGYGPADIASTAKSSTLQSSSWPRRAHGRSSHLYPWSRSRPKHTNLTTHWQRPGSCPRIFLSSATASPPAQTRARSRTKRLDTIVCGHFRNPSKQLPSSQLQRSSRRRHPTRPRLTRQFRPMHPHL